VIGGGIYTENLSFKDFGRPKVWTTIKNREGERVVVDGKTKDAPALLIEGSQYIRVEGLDMTNAQRHGLSILKSRHVKVIGCRSYENKWGGFLCLDASHCDWVRCVAHDNVSDSFNYNHARDSRMRQCVQYNGGNGLTVEQKSENILIDHNVFYKNWTDGILVCTQSKNVLLKENLIYDVYYKNKHDNGQGHGIKIAYGNDNVVVEGNIIAKCKSAFAYEIAGNGDRILYRNNIMAGIEARMPQLPQKAWDDEVLYKGKGDYPGFQDCGWYTLRDIEKNGWGSGNVYKDLGELRLEDKIEGLINL